MDRRRREESIRYWAPHAKQDAAHRDKARIRVVFGGNRSGKSEFCSKEVAAFALGARLWLPEDDPDYLTGRKGPQKILCVGESFNEQVKKVLVPKMLGGFIEETGETVPGSLPAAEIKGTKKNQQGVTTFIELRNGSQLHFQSYDQDPALFESTDFDVVWFDEPMPYSIWIPVQRGLVDRMGVTICAMTPLREPWIHQKIVKREDVSVYVFYTQDNVGFGLSQAGVDDFARNLDENEKRTRLRGEFFHLQGLVYDLYVRNSHIYRQPREKLLEKGPDGRFLIPHDWGVTMAIDPHPRTPHHAVWVVARPDERLIVVGELRAPEGNNNVAEFAKQILNYERNFLRVHSDRIRRLIDPSAKIKNPVDGRSMWDVFCDAGIYTVNGSKNRDGCIAMTKEHLRYSPEEGIYPTLFFCDDLPGIHDELGQYIWDDWTTRTGQYKTEKQVPRDKDDHFIENLHRIIADEPRPIDPAMFEAQGDVYTSDFSAGY